VRPDTGLRVLTVAKYERAKAYQVAIVMSVSTLVEIGSTVLSNFIDIALLRTTEDAGEQIPAIFVELRPNVELRPFVTAGRSHRI
jgi:hypothetical protein